MSLQPKKKERLVYLRRNVPANLENQYKDSNDFITQSVKSVGSYFEGGGSKRPGSGLDIWEEKLLLPDQLGMSVDDREYNKARDEYFSNFKTKVSSGDGQLLNIALQDDTQSLAKDNLPIVLMDYLRFRHALAHPFVAESHEEAYGNQLKHYYFEDPTQINRVRNDKAKISDAALTKYLEVKNYPEKVEMYLVLLTINTTGMSEEDKVVMLKEIATLRPDNFLAIYGDARSATKFTLNRLVAYQLLTQVGQTYLYGNKTIGYSELEACTWLENPVNGQDLLIMSQGLKSKVAEAKSNIVRG